MLWCSQISVLLLQKEKKMNLKQIRTDKGFTIPKLSEATGMPVRTIENIQRTGDCLVSNAIKLADALGVSLDELCRNKAGE